MLEYWERINSRAHEIAAPDWTKTGTSKLAALIVLGISRQSTWTQVRFKRIRLPATKSANLGIRETLLKRELRLQCGNYGLCNGSCLNHKKQGKVLMQYWTSWWWQGADHFRKIEDQTQRLLCHSNQVVFVLGKLTQNFLLRWGFLFSLSKYRKHCNVI